jgi:UDP-N-acetylmuramate dehydrogenase
MMAARREERLIERLPRVRGRLAEDAPLAPMTWFRVGGPAEILFRPADPEDLAAFLASKPADVPVTVIGVASNLLVRDGGIQGVVVRLGRGFADVAVEGESVHIGSGVLDSNVALACQQAGVAGLEFLSGIPGTVGGNLRMNAGAYGTEIKDVLVKAEALDPEGGRHELTPEEMQLSYRRCGVPPGWIFIGATLRGRKGDPAAIAARIGEIQTAREASQPVRARTGGSTFKNPPGHRAWALIDAAGCRGLSLGGAEVSEKHCNFLLNAGGATAAELEALGEAVRARVLAHSGVALEWEIRRIGLAAQGITGP